MPVFVCENGREGVRESEGQGERVRGWTPGKSKLPARLLPESLAGENSVCLRAKRGQ